VRVLVTGASGFVGGHLLPRLAREGHEAIATNEPGLDVTDAAAVRAAFERERPDAVVHLAAVSSVPASREAPDTTFRVNYLGTRAVLESAARGAPSARLLLVGSGDEYGAAPPESPPFRECDPLRPGSPYARSKAAADLLGAAFAERGLDVVRVRAFNHTGPGQSDVFVAASFARQVAEIEAGRREPVLRVGNLDSRRDFLDVEDVVDAYGRLLHRDVPARAYNVARGEGVRIGDLLERLLARARVRPAVEVDPERVRPLDVSVGDPARLRAATGWAPRIDLDTLVDRLLAWWRERVSAA